MAPKADIGADTLEGPSLAIFGRSGAHPILLSSTPFRGSRTVNTVKSPTPLSTAMEQSWLNRDDRSLCTFVTAMRKRAMHLRRFANFWIALLVAAGLFSAPLPAPLFLKTEPAAAAEMQAMADDMPCCPDQKADDGCACPLLALCTLTISLPAPSGDGWLARRWSRNAIAWPDDPMIDGIGEHPPDHPPRNLV